MGSYLRGTAAYDYWDAWAAFFTPHNAAPPRDGSAYANGYYTAQLAQQEVFAHLAGRG